MLSEFSSGIPSRVIPGRDGQEVATLAARSKADADNLNAQHRNTTLNSRAVVPDESKFWELSLMSVPPGERWSGYFTGLENSPGTFLYEADDSFGRGQTIYLVEDNIPSGHSVSLEVHK